MAKKRSLRGLGELQAEVMEIVWNLGEATVSQVHERIALRRKALYTTVLVAMQKLDNKKGWLKHRREGRANVYRPARSREATQGSLLKDVLGQVFEGNPHVLLSSLLEQHPMSDEELADLKKLIDVRRREKRRE